MATFLPLLLLFLIISSVQGRRESKRSSGRRKETFDKTRPESVAVKRDDEKALKFLVGGSGASHLGGEELEDIIGPSYQGNCSGGVCHTVSSSERGDAELQDRMGRSNWTFQNLNLKVNCSSFAHCQGVRLDGGITDVTKSATSSSAWDMSAHSPPQSIYARGKERKVSEGEEE